MCALALGVGHHGGCCRTFGSRRVDRRCGVVVSCVYIGICRVEYRAIGDTLMMSIILGTGSIGAAASSTNWLLCRVFRAGTSLGNDAWRQWRQNRRNRTRRRVFLHDGTSCINGSLRSPLSHGRHGAPLPAFKHTTISKHTMRQDYVVKTRKKYH